MDHMNITIKDFLSLKNVEFSIEKGITVIAGQNGSGKSQLLLGIAHNDCNGILLQSYGYGDKYQNKILNEIQLVPEPKLVLFRPAVRLIAYNNKHNEMASMQPLTDIINPSPSNNKIGYSYSVDNRFIHLYTILANIYISGTNTESSEQDKANWQKIKGSFKEVFNKELCGHTDFFCGTKVGIKLTDGTIASVNSLSTGEQEFLSLLCDLLLEFELPEQNLSQKETTIETPIRSSTTDLVSLKNFKREKADLILIDELDAHFHPDLQLKIIKKIEELCIDKYVVITTHSPSIMLSVSNDKLFFLSRYTDCEIGNRNADSEITYCNQIEKLSESFSLYKKLEDMYKGFTADLNLIKHYSQASNLSMLKFAEQCLKEDSTALPPESAKEWDLQIHTLKISIIQCLKPEIIEVGCGLGRNLMMFKGLDKEVLNRITYIGTDIRDENIDTLNKYIENERIKTWGFKDLKIQRGVSDDLTGNFCIFANIIHEVEPPQLDEFLNSYIKKLKPDSTCWILEALELAVGEKAFVMLGPIALRALFSELIEKKIVEMVIIPHTAPKTPLMSVMLKILQPSAFFIAKGNVVSALSKVIEFEINTLKMHFENKNKLNATSFSFHSHNLANATMYKNVIENSI